MPRIVIDAMGSDNYPDPEIEGAVQAVKKYNEEIILVGQEEVLKPKVAELGGEKIRIVHAPEIFKMTSTINNAELRKGKSSMSVGMQLVKSGEADAFLTMGNTGGTMANGLIKFGRIRGIKRPALTLLMPVRNGRSVVLDIGANAECKPEFLQQFAIMGSVYAEAALNVKNPRVGLLSNGEEAGKGNELIKAAFPLLQQSSINFIGNLEGKELFAGEADVVVTDGFTGNILLKSTEAVAKLIIETLRENIMSSLQTKIGGLLLKPAFAKLRALLDPAEYGAVPLLGLNGLVFVGHGRSQAKAVVSAIGAARQAVEVNLLESIKEKVEASITSS